MEEAFSLFHISSMACVCVQELSLIFGKRIQKQTFTERGKKIVKRIIYHALYAPPLPRLHPSRKAQNKHPQQPIHLFSILFFAPLSFGIKREGFTCAYHRVNSASDALKIILRILAGSARL